MTLVDPHAALPAEPHSVERIVADGRHNAFAAFAQWRGRYVLAFRKGTGHTSRDGDLVVLDSPDARSWEEVARFDTGGDDRDAQLVALGDRLWLYFNTLTDGLFAVYACSSADGRAWSAPQKVYRDGYILWQPVEFAGRLYAGVHRPGADDYRHVHLAVSDDGLGWDKISAIREGRGESETSLLFADNGRLTAFLRDQTRVGGAILEADPPYDRWTERSAGVHLSGQAVYTFDGVIYVFSRVFACDRPLAASAPRSALVPPLDQGTMAYTYANGALAPYCLLSPLAGNHDSSYATAVREGDEMWVVFHRAAHAYAGAYTVEDAADLYLARVPLQQVRDGG